MTSRIRFGIIGAGWRTHMFLDVARARPDLFDVAAVVTANPDRAAAVTAKGFTPVASAADLLKLPGMEFVLISVPRDAVESLITQVTAAGLPILAETPPAGSVEGLLRVWALAQKGARVQVAEQYHLQPNHAARLSLARSGLLGDINQAQVSIAHGYHGTSLMRLFLGIKAENCKISGRGLAPKIVQGPGRNGPPQAEKIVSGWQLILNFDFPDGKLGIIDFSGDQYFSYIRSPRLLVRGTRGEISNQSAAWLVDHLTPIRANLIRHEAGPDGNLEGLYLKGIQIGETWRYKNPLLPGRLTDDEIAMGDCLLRMSHYARTGQPFYSLAAACQDTYLDLLSQQAASSGTIVETQTQPWADQV
jgi:hypothetical protein